MRASREQMWNYYRQVKKRETLIRVSKKMQLNNSTSAPVNTSAAKAIIKPWRPTFVTHVWVKRTTVTKFNWNYSIAFWAWTLFASHTYMQPLRVIDNLSGAFLMWILLTVTQLFFRKESSKKFCVKHLLSIKAFLWIFLKLLFNSVNL